MNYVYYIPGPLNENGPLSQITESTKMPSLEIPSTCVASQSIDPYIYCPGSLILQDHHV